MYKWILLLILLPAVAMGQFVTPTEDTTVKDSIGVDADDDGTFEAYIYPSYIQKGSNITLTVDNDTLTIAGAAGSGTRDSMGIDSDGDGTVDARLYSTTAGGAFFLKKGSNITLTVDTDTVTIAATGGSGFWYEGTDTLFAIDSDGDTVAAFWDDDAGATTWQVATEDQTLSIVKVDSIETAILTVSDSLIMDGEIIKHMTGTGIGLVANELSASLGTAVETTEVTTAHWNEYVPDHVSEMVTGNTETGIDVTYEDGDNTLDFVVSSDIVNHTLDSAEVMTIQYDSLGGTATRTDNYELRIDTDPDPDTFYWAVAGAGGIWSEGTDTLFAIDSDGDTLAAFWDDDAGNVRWQVATEDQTLRLLLDSLGIGGDLIADFAGTGLTVDGSNNLTADLGTLVDGSELDTGLKDSITAGQIANDSLFDWFAVPFATTDDNILVGNAGGTGFASVAMTGPVTMNNGVTAIPLFDTNYTYLTAGGQVIDDADSVASVVELADSLDEYALLDDPTFTTGITVPANSISDEELDESANFDWTGTHTFTNIVDVQNDTLRADTVLVDNELRIPSLNDPGTADEGHIAWDANDDALEVFSGDEAEAVLIPIYRQLIIPIVLPDSVQAYVPDLCVFHANSLMYPHGIEIDLVSIQLEADAAYEMVWEVWSAADPPVYENAISTLATGASDTYAEEAPDTDAVVEAGKRIFLDIPTTDVDLVVVSIYYHVTEGN